MGGLILDFHEAWKIKNEPLRAEALPLSLSFSFACNKDQVTALSDALRAYDTEKSSRELSALYGRFNTLAARIPTLGLDDSGLSNSTAGLAVLPAMIPMALLAPVTLPASLLTLALIDAPRYALHRHREDLAKQGRSDELVDDATKKAIYKPLASLDHTFASEPDVDALEGPVWEQTLERARDIARAHQQLEQRGKQDSDIREASTPVSAHDQLCFS